MLPFHRHLAILLAIALAIGCAIGIDAPTPVRLTLALTALVGTLWLTEAIDLTYTALLIPVLATVLGLLPLKAALAEFANPVIFLFLGGFALAAALRQQGLDATLGRMIVQLSGKRPAMAAWCLFGATAFLSLWISNTATMAMMLPLAMGIARRFDARDVSTLQFLLLGTAYAASIGGMGTLVGSPPNAIAAAHQGIDFARWMQFGLPVVLVAMPLMVLMLHALLRPAFRVGETLDPKVPAVTPQAQRGSATVLIIFALTVLGWTFSAPLSTLTGISRDFDAWVALAALLLLGITRRLRWQEVETGTGWGILLLFGGGMTLGALLETSGTSRWLIGHIAGLTEAVPPILALLLLITFIVFLSELVSNTAAAALLVPLLVPLAPTLGLSTELMAVTVALAASSSFMLPVATPPNAIAFGTGALPQRVMIRCGSGLNLLFILLLTLLAVALKN